MEIIKQLLDFVLHLDKHLDSIITTFGSWTYVLLFAVIFCETGLVITPFLPGDSFLFALGTLSALGSIDIYILIPLLIIAAVVGDNLNYFIGRRIGSKVFYLENSRFLNKEYLQKTHEYYEKYGGKTLIFARFMPFVRTFAPFVAGVGNMTYIKFLTFSIAGGVAWISSLTLIGYFFGNIPVVKNSFSIVIVSILVISVVPGIYEFVRMKYGKQK